MKTTNHMCRNISTCLKNNREAEDTKWIFKGIRIRQTDNAMEKTKKNKPT